MDRRKKEIAADLGSYLQYLKGMGIEELPSEDRLSAPPLSKKARGLSDVRKELGNCKRCKLHGTRRSIVFGEGNEKAKLMFIGEGPGYDEDVQGRPFVGRAGQLLTNIIQSIDLRREEVYIANVVKCRPPQNRNPERDEIESCYPFLLKQIYAIKPKIICALGAFAAQTLLKSEAKITALRGRFYDFEKIQILPTYHPAFLLRNPERKKEVWEDVKKIRTWMTANCPGD
jgi:DNA polymerase